MRPEKISIVGDIRETIDSAEYVLFADYGGMTMEQFHDLRGRLRKNDARVKVVKNAFMRVVAEEKKWALGELQGSTAMVAGQGDVSAVAKLLKDFAKETNKGEVKSGVMGEAILSADDVKAIAELPPREVLLAILLGTMAAPMSQLVGVMNQKLASIVYVLKAAADKKSA
jgi:large subunit ribosomal protein L10